MKRRKQPRWDCLPLCVGYLPTGRPCAQEVERRGECCPACLRRVAAAYAGVFVAYGAEARSR